MARDDPKPPRTPRERTGMVLCPRDARGRLLRLDALARFASKCQFDPATGCVLWVGGKTRGRGNTATYGSFWYDGARWFAHRWAGVHIHGLALDGVQAGHCCPSGPDTLCVEHVTGQSIAENMAEQIARLGPVGKRIPRAEQSAHDRQYWLLVERGYEQLPEQPAAIAGDIPFHTPPEWLRPFMAQPETAECPF